MYQKQEVGEIQIDFGHELEESLPVSHLNVGQSRETRLTNQSTWEASVASAAIEIASFDPRPVGHYNPPRKKYFKNGQWSDIDEGFLQVDAEVSSPPQSLPAHQALEWSDGHRNVDMRPHLFDKTSDNFILVDSGSAICCAPPDPGDQVSCN